MNLVNAVCGANMADHHFINVSPSRDFKPDQVADLRLIKEGDPCPRCGAAVKTARGIEVGQVFKLHTKYSEALEATYLDENGQEQLMVMGCYGVGVSRTMAAAIEQHHDEDGIIWPAAIAPYQLVIVPINIKDEAQMTLCARYMANYWKRALMSFSMTGMKDQASNLKMADLIVIRCELRWGLKR